MKRERWGCVAQAGIDRRRKTMHCERGRLKCDASGREGELKIRNWQRSDGEGEIEQRQASGERGEGGKRRQSNQSYDRRARVRKYRQKQYEGPCAFTDSCCGEGFTYEVLSLTV